jgi:hypothetical protein
LRTPLGILEGAISPIPRDTRIIKLLSFHELHSHQHA